MNAGDSIRVIFRKDNNDEIIRKIIKLPDTYEELRKECCKEFNFTNQEMKNKMLFLKCYGNPDIYLVDENYLKGLKEDEIYYEIEIKEKKPNDIIKNKDDFKLAQLEEEKNKETKLIKEKKIAKFCFHLLNKGNFEWKAPFQISNEKILEDNKNLLACSKETIYQSVPPNEKVHVKVTIIELEKKK